MSSCLAFLASPGHCFQSIETQPKVWSKPSKVVNLSIKLTVESPPAGVLVGLQTGKGSDGKPVDVRTTTGGNEIFDLQVTAMVADNGQVKFGGPYIQKDAKGQFFYLRWGRSAGQFGTCIDRRTKIYLGTMTPEVVSKAVTNGTTVQILIAGTAKDGGPCCATVPVRLS